MSYFKRNIWMLGIITGFVIFVTGMVSFVVLASNNRISLVTTDYYQAEIEYQKQINKLNNTASLAQKPEITHVKSGNLLSIKYPDLFNRSEIHGRIAFYRPDNPADDQEISLALNKDNTQEISLVKLKKGNWKVKIDWNAQGIDYYQEEKLMIQ